VSRRSYYTWLVASFTFGLIAIALAPEPTLALLVAGVPAAIVAATVSTIYLRHVFHQQPLPRSRFFRMLLESFYSLLFVGAWVGYLTVGRLTERAHDAGQLSWNVPVPPPAFSAPLSALVVIVVFTPPVRFALVVYRARARASSSADELDREGEPEQAGTNAAK
jgi:MFS family permease